MGFLAHLAGLARGETPMGAARVSLPPRFAEAGAVAGQPFAEVVDEGRAASVESASRQPSRDPMQRIETPPMPSRSWGPEERRDEPGVSMGSRPIPPPSTDAPTRHVDLPEEAGQRRPAARSIADGRGQNRVAVPAQVGTRTATQSRPLSLSADNAPSSERLSGDGASSVPASVAPLSDAAVASRPRASREAPPVIEVMIDRLDVRAPVVPKAAADRRKSRPLPSQSLADYLRGGAGGGRR